MHTFRRGAHSSEAYAATNRLDSSQQPRDLSRKELFELHKNLERREGMPGACISLGAQDEEMLITKWEEYREQFPDDSIADQIIRLKGIYHHITQKENQPIELSEPKKERTATQPYKPAKPETLSEQALPKKHILWRATTVDELYDLLTQEPPELSMHRTAEALGPKKVHTLLVPEAMLAILHIAQGEMLSPQEEKILNSTEQKQLHEIWKNNHQKGYSLRNDLADLEEIYKIFIEKRKRKQNADKIQHDLDLGKETLEALLRQLERGNKNNSFSVFNEENTNILQKKWQEYRKKYPTETYSDQLSHLTVLCRQLKIQEHFNKPELADVDTLNTPEKQKSYQERHQLMGEFRVYSPDATINFYNITQEQYQKLKEVVTSTADTKKIAEELWLTANEIEWMRDTLEAHPTKVHPDNLEAILRALFQRVQKAKLQKLSENIPIEKQHNWDTLSDKIAREKKAMQDQINNPQFGELTPGEKLDNESRLNIQDAGLTLSRQIAYSNIRTMAFPGFEKIMREELQERRNQLDRHLREFPLYTRPLNETEKENLKKDAAQNLKDTAESLKKSQENIDKLRRNLSERRASEKTITMAPEEISKALGETQYDDLPQKTSKPPKAPKVNSPESQFSL